MYLFVVLGEMVLKCVDLTHIFLGPVYTKIHYTNTKLSYPRQVAYWCVAYMLARCGMAGGLLAYDSGMKVAYWQAVHPACSL